MGHTYTAHIPNKITGCISWSHAEDATWKRLISRQKSCIQQRVCDEFLEGLIHVNFPTDYIPQHIELSTTLGGKTGWSVIPVAAIIPAEEFLSLLSMRQFPGASFMRIPEELDYIEEPDIFHEFFGHIPLLAWQEYADFVGKFGEIGLRIDPSLHPYLLRIFWYTVEFGLIRQGDIIQAYGAGILSSYGELDRALRADLVSHRPFDIWECIRTPYRYDRMQKQYFVIDSFHELFSIFEQFDLIRMFEEAKERDENTPCIIEDEIFHIS